MDMEMDMELWIGSYGHAASQWALSTRRSAFSNGHSAAAAHCTLCTLCARAQSPFSSVVAPLPLDKRTRELTPRPSARSAQTRKGKGVPSKPALALATRH